MDIKNINESIKTMNKGLLVYANCLNVLRTMPSNVTDLIVTDPPYGYSFMGKNWDKALPDIAIFRECLRVLKPGAFAFVMAAPRQDVLSRMMIKLEDAGFKTDFTSLYWTYASGFPKAHNIGKKHKELKGAYGGFQPKPAIEIIIVVQKPGTHRTQCDQALDNGKGVTWLDDCRIPYPNGEKSSAGNRTATFGTQETISGGDSSGGWKMCKEGRFPANLLVSDDVLNDVKKPNQGHSPRGKVTGYGNFGGGKQEYHGVGEKFKDKGTYSRFFSLDAWAQRHLPFLIVPKASKKEKNAGLQDREQQTTNDGKKKSIDNPFQRDETLLYNNHPTVKPVELMTYLIKMGSREGDIVLDPFCGSGTTCVASMLLDRKFIGIEQDKNYIQIAKKRLLNIPKVKKCDEPGKVIRSSEIKSIGPHRSGDTVIDMQAISSVIHHALENKGRTSSYKGFEIIRTYRTKISDSEKELDETPSQYQKIASGMKKNLTADLLNRCQRNRKR